jgi:hypothetical protein
MIDQFWYTFVQRLVATDDDGTVLITQEDLHSPTLLNGWTQKASYETAGYWKDSCGVVHLQGAITGGTSVAHTPLFLLPDGYLPSARVDFIDAGSTVLYVDTSSGELRIASGTPADIFLDSITYRAYA